MRKYFCLLILGFVTLVANGQHYVGFSVDGAYASKQDQLKETANGLGGGAQIGFDYEFQRNRFILVTGLATSYMATSHLLDSVHVSFPMFDTRGVAMNYIGIVDDRRDIIRQFHLKVPLMAGLEGGHFYALAGFVFDFSFRAWTMQKANLYTAGDYDDRYYDLLTDMPNHGYHDFEPTVSKGTLRFHPDLRIAVETGGTFLIGNRPNPPKMKIGLFFEYGLNDINREDLINNKLYDFDLKEYMQVEMSHIYTTKLVYGSKINNVEVGLRAHLLFNVGGTPVNGGCNCHKLWL